MEFTDIPKGEFLMGCDPHDSECHDDEKPQRLVKITKPFYIGRYEVTRGQFYIMGDKYKSQY